MIIETNLVDLSKVTLDNPKSWNEYLKYEVPKQWGLKKVKKLKRKPKTPEERKIAQKIYQHNYYLKVRKPKRQARRNNGK